VILLRQSSVLALIGLDSDRRRILVARPARRPTTCGIGPWRWEARLTRHAVGVWRYEDARRVPITVRSATIRVSSNTPTRRISSASPTASPASTTTRGL
jgi:hypothetical protein